MTTAISLNGIAAVSVRLLTPWRGVWIADVDLDQDVAVAPSGPATLVIGTNTPAMGTVDPRGTGIFAGKARARVLGGAGGWDKPVVPQHFHNDAGIMDSVVITATAAAVLEKIVMVDAPTRLGVDYVRAAGPASRVLSGREWHVELTGITMVGPRPPVPVNAINVEVLSWDPLSQRAELATDVVVAPGSVLVDPRFGTAVVRDVEQTWSAGGGRAFAWCGTTQTSRLAGAMRKFAEEALGVAFLRHYKYRVVSQNVDGRLLLQPVKINGAAPPAIALPVWPGMAGVAAQVLPGTEVIVGFIEGDPSQPYVHAFASGSFPTAKPVAKAPELVAWAALVNGALNSAGFPVAPLAPTVIASHLKAE